MPMIASRVLMQGCSAGEDLLWKVEARGRARTNLIIRDMDILVPKVHDGRRLEVVVDGLPLRGGAQLAIDTTMVCAMHRDGAPRRGCGSGWCCVESCEAEEGSH